MNKKKNSIKSVEPKNKKQKQFLNAIVDKSIVFSTGSAGSGKTFLAAAKALEYLDFGFVDRIIIVRPVVATEKLGFLPGGIEEKLDPYLLPLFDAFTGLTDTKTVQNLLKTKKIEIAPLAFMRGRTFSNAFIILDEAQNTTVAQMTMFLTRFGENVKVTITGDLSQSDLSEQNGLAWAKHKLQYCNSVSFIEYSSDHVVRSDLVKNLLMYIEDSNDKSEKAFNGRVPSFIESASYGTR